LNPASGVLALARKTGITVVPVHCGMMPSAINVVLKSQWRRCSKLWHAPKNLCMVTRRTQHTHFVLYCCTAGVVHPPGTSSTQHSSCRVPQHQQQNKQQQQQPKKTGLTSAQCVDWAVQQVSGGTGCCGSANPVAGPTRDLLPHIQECVTGSTQQLAAAGTTAGPAAARAAADGISTSAGLSSALNSC
jgi:hypothetical protein